MRVLGFILAVACSTLVGAAPAARPNIVFILADDMGYMDIGANNPKTFYETPNIDGLARSGMRFTEGHSACPVCSPTRASIMTGRYPVRTGVTEWIGEQRHGKMKAAPYRDHLALEEVTMAEAFRDKGYATFMAGKWHLGIGQYAPKAQGFNKDLVAFPGEYFPATDAAPLDKVNDPKSTERIADAAVRFIGANKDRPFFAYLPFRAVHLPLGARAELIEKYKRKRASAPADAFIEDRGAKVRQVQADAAYAAMVEQFDTAIGRVLTALEKNGLTERTIVVFTSDNGGVSTAQSQPTANVPLRAGKGWLYEGGIRVPWIIRAPGVAKAGAVCEAPAISNDFFPTLLDLAALPLLPERHSDGVSLRPLLEGRAAAQRTFYWHYPHYGGQGGFPGGVVREGDWKLIEWYEDGSLELFNLRTDIGEQKNLAKTESERTKALHAKLDE
ncbi:MAG: sulfatase, partial [Verrucomicrobiota bacterium]